MKSNIIKAIKPPAPLYLFKCPREGIFYSIYSRRET